MSNTLNLGTDGNWATKKNSLLAYNSENNNYKPLPFDFSRGSSATVINKDGLIETVGSGEPRIDYKDNSKGALLLEPSRTNLITYSEDFSNAAWNKINTTIQSDESISPNGSLNASKLITDNSNSVHIITDALSGSLQMTYSVFFKKGEYKYGSMSLLNGGNSRGSGVVIDLDTFQVVSSQTSSSSFTFKADNYGNGWIRCELTVTNTNSIISLAVIGSWNGVGSVTWNAGFRTPSYTGNSSKGVYIYGAQVEQGYATSYIPTQGGVVTRLADVCEQTVPDGVIGQTELTLFYKGLVERLGGNDGHAIALSQSADALGSSRILLYRNSGNGNMYVYVQDSTTQFSTPLLVNSNPQINDKYAIAIKDNDLVIYCNGVKVAENNSGTIPATQYIYLNEWNNQINEKNLTQEVKLYNTRLSNSELQALTTI